VISDAIGDRVQILRTVEPSTEDDSDLEALRDVVGDARVVAIGESAHGVREFYQLKDRFLRFLVRELGFTAFAMESGFPEGLTTNDWVLGADGDVDAVLRNGITYSMGACDEMCAQLTWMRAWNESHDRKVRFYGMDVPGSCTTLRPAVEVCVARLGSTSNDARLLDLADLGSPAPAALARYSSMEAADRSALTEGIEDLMGRATRAGDEIAYRCALSARYLNDVFTKWASGPSSDNPRDELMAANVAWILEREDRVVIGAHNGHIQRAPFSGMAMLGQHLAKVLGDQMVVIGTTYGSGKVINYRATGDGPEEVEMFMDELSPPPPDTADALLAEADAPYCMIDLRRLGDALTERFNALTSMRVNHNAVPVDVTKAFDAIVHVESVSPSHRIDELALGH
jgi:erythromycin esterase-like protein